MSTIRSRKIRFAWVQGAALAACLAAPAHAQTVADGQASEAAADAADGSGDIIVTATRRSESIQKVPIAVSVVDGELMRQQGLANLKDIAAQVPTLNFRTAASNKDQAVFVRGLGTVSTSPGVEPSVSTVLDGVVLARQGQATLDLLDIERVEVLRGPQGTLFGKNASAGVLNIVSKKPDDDFRAFVDVSAFEDGEGRARVGLAGPITPGRVAIGVNMMATTYRGNVRNVFNGKRVNGYDKIGTRARLRITPSDTVELLLTADYVWSKDTTPQGVPARTFLTAFPTNVVTNFPNFATAFKPAVASEDGRIINSNYNTNVVDENMGVAGELNVELGDFTITSISAWRGWNNKQLQDQDRLPAAVVGIPQLHDVGKLDFDQISQEIRLTSPKGEFLDYVLGAFYFRGRNNENYRRQTTVRTAAAATITNGVADYGVVNKNFAVFGEANLHFSERFRALAGLRWVHDELSYDFNRVSSSPTPVTGIQTSFKAGGSTVSKDFAGRAGLQFDLAPRAMIYGTYSRGYKGPAYNPAFSMLPQDTLALKPETSDAYELGLKSKLFDGAMTFNLAGFLQKLENYQVPFFDTFNNSPVTRLINAGRVSTRGVEADLSAQAGDHLTLSGAVAYTDAKVDEFTCPAGTNASCQINGHTLPYAPKWRINGRAEYRAPLSGGVDLVLGTDVNWRTSTQYSINQTPDTIQSGYAIWNANIGIATDGGLRVMLLARNLTDRSYSTFLTRFGQGVARFVPRDDQRYFGISINKDF